MADSPTNLSPINQYHTTNPNLNNPYHGASLDGLSQRCATQLFLSTFNGGKKRKNKKVTRKHNKNRIKNKKSKRRYKRQSKRKSKRKRKTLRKSKSRKVFFGGAEDDCTEHNGASISHGDAQKPYDIARQPFIAVTPDWSQFGWHDAVGQHTHNTVNMNWIKGLTNQYNNASKCQK
jgi:hypothetical protein